VNSHRADRFRLLAAVHLFLLRDGHVLLSRRCNTGYADGQYSVIAGHLDGGEEVRAATIREALEEAGITVAERDLTMVGIMHRKAEDERIDFFLTAARWTGEVTNAEPRQCDELSWHPRDSLPDNVVPYVRQALDNYRRGVWFDSYGWSNHRE